MDQGNGVSESGATGGRAVRKCNLVAQSPLHADRSIQTGGRETPDRQRHRTWELLYFKVYKSQLQVIEQALETAGLLLGTNKSRGYCLEMICADFLAGAALDAPSTQTMLLAMGRLYELLPDQMKTGFLRAVAKAGMIRLGQKRPHLRLEANAHDQLHRQVLERDRWRCQQCGSGTNLQVHHLRSGSKLGHDVPENLITLCAVCHEQYTCTGDHLQNG
jgi:HNH endonuclease